MLLNARPRKFTRLGINIAKYINLDLQTTTREIKFMFVHVCLTDCLRNCENVQCKQLTKVHLTIRNHMILEVVLLSALYQK